ncbi:unnamed protein product, partial [Rotaria magnacalcarata]
MTQNKDDNLQQQRKMSDDSIDGNSLLILLRDAIVQHSPLKYVKAIL